MRRPRRELGASGQPALGGAFRARTEASLVTALATPGEKKQQKATGAEKSRGGRVTGLPGGGLGIKRGARRPRRTLTRGRQPERARRHPRGRGADSLFERADSFPSGAGGGGEGRGAKGDAAGRRKPPPGNRAPAQLAALAPSPGRASWAGPAARSAGSAEQCPGDGGCRGEVSGLGRDCVGAAEEQDVSDGFAELLCLPSYRRLSSPRFREAMSVDRLHCHPLAPCCPPRRSNNPLAPFVSRLPSSFPSSPFPTPSPAFSAPSVWF